MGAIEEQALTIKRRSLKWWGIWRTRFLKNLLSILRAWIRNDEVMNEEDDEVEGSRRSLPTKQINKSIQLSFHDIVFIMHLFIFSWCIMHDRMFASTIVRLLICMWWVSSSWFYTTLHFYLYRMKPLYWHIWLVHNLNVVMVEMEGI